MTKKMTSFPKSLIFIFWVIRPRAYSKLDRVKTRVLVEKLTPFDEILR